MFSRTLFWETAMQPRCAILIRRSKDDRTEEPEEVMRTACLTYAQGRGFLCDPKTDVFADIGETGGLVVNNGQVELPTDRPAVKRLLKRLADYQVVCIYKYDRLSRDPFTMGLLPYLFLSNGLQVISPIEGDLDPNKTESKLNFVFQGFKAEAEVRDIRQRSMDAINEIVRQGKNPGKGRASYGYVYEKLAPGKRAGRRRVRDPKTTPIVERIFREIAGKRSLYMVAKGLTDDGIPTPTGGKVWNTKTIANMIRDPSYKGEPIRVNKYQSLGIKVRSRNGKLWTRGVKSEGKPIGEPTPAIVDDRLWVKANEALDKRYKPPFTSLVCDTWLRGRVHCDNCYGARMGLEHRYGYWISNCRLCRLQARHSVVCDHAWKFICDVVNNPETLRWILLAGTEDESLDQLRATLATLDKEAGTFEARKGRIFDLIEEKPMLVSGAICLPGCYRSTPSLRTTARLSRLSAANSMRLSLRKLGLIGPLPTSAPWLQSRPTTTSRPVSPIWSD